MLVEPVFCFLKFILCVFVCVCLCARLLTLVYVQVPAEAMYQIFWN